MTPIELDLDSILQFTIKLALDVSLVSATTYNFVQVLNGLYVC